MAMKLDVYAIVTDKILAMLEKGVVPWHKPWKGWAGGAPSNIFSKTEYRGINTLMLAVTADEKGFNSPYWLTFKQLATWGGRVTKGEKATPVVFWKEIKVTEKVTMENLETGEMEEMDHESSRWIIRYYSVFNTDQTEGIEGRVPTVEIDPVNGNGVIPRCETIVEGFEDAPPVTFGGGRAFYRPTSDAIKVPPIEAFENSEEFYSTLFHEFIHSTGHETRCNRDMKGWFGDPNYSKEELVAEMGACFLASMTGIEDLTLKNSAGYIDHWMRKIRDDKKLVVSAAGLAQKAVDHMTAGMTPAPLIKGEIVGKCQLCSETWDQADLDDANRTMVCPYCQTDLDEYALQTLHEPATRVLPDGGEPDTIRSYWTGKIGWIRDQYGDTIAVHWGDSWRSVETMTERGITWDFLEEFDWTWFEHVQAPTREDDRLMVMLAGKKAITINGYPARCFSGHYGTPHCDRCEKSFRTMCDNHHKTVGAVRDLSPVVEPLDAHDQNVVEWMRMAEESRDASDYVE